MYNLFYVPLKTLQYYGSGIMKYDWNLFISFMMLFRLNAAEMRSLNEICVVKQ